MLYEGYHFFGMHLVWWFVWLCLFIWIFVMPYNIPGQRSKKKTPLDILQERFTSEQISAKEYEEKRDAIENELENENIFNYYFL